ncbi:MAG: hypothetical protein EAZ61_11150 [Oscillatoriales cyanobacterium]|nr:MAG: hypothetical protein EAZ61_11150 [Oscillatoriales cyanobacterium]
MNDRNERDAAVATALYAALGSLDVQLEAELERYRAVRKRQDTGDRPVLDRPAIIPEATIADAVIPITAAAELIPDERIAQEGSDLSDSPFDLESGSDDFDLELSAPVADRTGREGLSGEVSAVPASESPIAGASATPPEGYLASSEALLASNRNRRRQARKASPLGVGGVVLLLLTSATIGYVLVNPESLDRLGWRDWFDRQADQPAADPNPVPVAEAEATADLPTSPNLAAEEFVDIQIDTLSELAPPATPTPAPAPNPSPTPSPSAAPDSIDNLANALAPQTNPANSAPTATPTPTATPAPNAMPPLPEVKADPNYNGYYLVVVNEGNNAALARIQGANPEAYFEDILGARRIQVGAYDSLAIAQEVADRLKAQGLPAQVYRP